MVNLMRWIKSTGFALKKLWRRIVFYQRQQLTYQTGYPNNEPCFNECDLKYNTEMGIKFHNIDVDL